jgi:hypothetical protein
MNLHGCNKCSALHRMSLSYPYGGINFSNSKRLENCLPSVRCQMVIAAATKWPCSGYHVGDFLDKPGINGGLAISRYSATALLLALIVLLILAFPHRAAKRSH